MLRNLKRYGGATIHLPNADGKPLCERQYHAAPDYFKVVNQEATCKQCFKRRDLTAERDAAAAANALASLALIRDDQWAKDKGMPIALMTTSDVTAVLHGEPITVMTADGAQVLVRLYLAGEYLARQHELAAQFGTKAISPEEAAERTRPLPKAEI